MKYYPNNWSQIKNAPDECFPELTFQEFIEMKYECESLRPGVKFLIRAQRKDTGEVTEHKYKMPNAFQKRVENYLLDDEVELTVFTPETGTVILERLY